MENYNFSGHAYLAAAAGTLLLVTIGSVSVVESMTSKWFHFLHHS
jgi:hypothetical protein